tara:strand:+ start:584 stop:1333 length:750 start_codon:yes stop_codon:yes gene_type:complete
MSKYGRGPSAEPMTGRRVLAKEALRQRCVARAQQHRREVLLRRREGGSAEPMDAQALCREIVSAEMRSGGCGVVDDDDDDSPWAHLSQDAFIDIMTATEQTLLQEMRDDLASIDDIGGGDDEEAARHYEEYLRGEEERIQALLEQEEAQPPDGGGGNLVPCPLCHQGFVWQTQGVLECSQRGSHGCAFRLLTHDHPAPLQLLRERLGTLLQQHALSGCRGHAQCRMPIAGEAGMLLLGCGTCGSQVTVV